MKTYFILIALLLMNAFLFSQEKQHTVEPKETLYGLSKKYDISIEDLKNANPKLKDRTPQIGEILVIPDTKSKKVPTQNENNYTTIETPNSIKTDSIVEKKKKRKKEKDPKEAAVEKIVKSNTSDSEYLYVTIKPKETLYSLSKEYNTTIETIQSLNPTMDKKGPKIGEVLKLPNNNVATKGGQTTSSNTIGFKTNNSNTSYDKDAINVILFLPFNSDSNKDSKEGEIALDFYSGVKLALDSLSNKGKRFNVKILDTSNETKFNNIINTYDFSNTNLIIGPLFKSDLTTVAKKVQDIPIVSPFTSNDDLDDYSNIIMYNTKDQTLVEKLADEMLKKYDSEKTYILYDDNHYQNALYFQSIILNRRNNAEVVLTKQASDIKLETNMVTDETENIYAILISDQDDLTQQYLERISEMSAENVTPISLNYSSLFDSSKYLNKLLSMGLMYSDISYVNENGFNEEKTMKLYQKKYCNPFSKYSVSGFDVTYDILNRLDSKGNLSDNAMKVERKQLSNKYYFNRIKKNSAWSNQGARIIKLM